MVRYGPRPTLLENELGMKLAAAVHTSEGSQLAGERSDRLVSTRDFLLCRVHVSIEKMCLRVNATECVSTRRQRLRWNE